jgi:peptidoglycan hydrolase-like protein with peptidoglycan-binding domain
MKYNDKGKDVLDMQHALLGQGYQLPKYGADGHFGNETMAALKDFTEHQGIEWTSDEVPQAALDALIIDAVPVEVPPVPDQALGDVKLYDLRDVPWDTKGDQFTQRNQKKFKRSGGKPVVRDPAMITGITVHQTAVKYGVKDYQIHAAGGDENLALARRSLQVACHVMAFCRGFIAAPNPLASYVYHGNSPFNATELGIEIDGNYPGLIGGQTWNNSPHPTKVTAALVHAACAGIEYLVREGRKEGMPIEHIHAHRQSSATRRGDPGEELWRKIVLDYAVKELGLIPHQGEVFGDGRPVPTEWDPSGVGSY